MRIDSIKFLGITTLAIAVASCGGGGSSAPSSTTAPATIVSISPDGVVASGSPHPLSIIGTNFMSGMTVSVDGNNYPAVIISPTVITANVSITTVPTNNIVNVSIKSSTGATLGTVTLGVASAARTLAADVYPILDAKCRSCHTGAANGNLDFATYATTASANTTGLIGIPSSGCSQKYRVAVGDARRTSSVLIDKISASGTPCSGTLMPPTGSPALTSTEIQTIIDWVAGGAN
ncbi:MAG: hypothetical protein HOO95_01845 [Gallionella sp.]|nr:hypothetical protein [Gallionella sp.]